MVLRPTNFAREVDSENIPPAAATNPKGLVARIQNDVARRRRNRPTGSSRTPKYQANQAKRRSETRKHGGNVRFNVTPLPTIADVEMADACARPKSIPIQLPKELARPAYKEICRETIQSIAPSLEEPDVQFLRDTLQAIGPELMKSLTSVQISPDNHVLPKELTVLVNDMTTIIPSHMLAVFGKPPPIPRDGAPSPRRKVVLYPIHSLVLALHCANLPKPPTALPVPLHEPGDQHVELPVWNICLPSPMSYPQLSTYLYTKKIAHILQSFSPTMPPPTLMQDPAQVLPFATAIAETYTTQVITKHALAVHGLWQNVYALGIYDDNLWDAMDVLWKSLLTALAIATGEPSLMIEPAAPEPQPASSSSSSST